MSRRITPTYILLNQVTLAANASEIIFSSIPQGYADLILIGQHRMASAGETSITFNSDSGSNYSTVTMRGGAGSSTFSANFTTTGIVPQNAVGGATGSDDNFQLQIMDYSSTDKHKTTLLKSGNGLSTTTASFVQAHASRWANTAAITSIRCQAPYAAGSNFSLYGVIA
jgi:hypothetical protein